MRILLASSTGPRSASRSAPPLRKRGPSTPLLPLLSQSPTPHEAALPPSVCLSRPAPRTTTRASLARPTRTAARPDRRDRCLGETRRPSECAAGPAVCGDDDPLPPTPPAPGRVFAWAGVSPHSGGRSRNHRSLARGPLSTRRHMEPLSQQANGRQPRECRAQCSLVVSQEQPTACENARNVAGEAPGNEAYLS